MTKATVRKIDYTEKLEKVKGMLRNLGFDPEEVEEEVKAEEARRKEVGAHRKEEEKKRLEEENRRKEEEAHRMEEEEERLEETRKHTIKADKSDKEKSEYWREKLEEWDKERAKPKEPEREKVKPSDEQPKPIDKDDSTEKKETVDIPHKDNRQPEDIPLPTEEDHEELDDTRADKWADETYTFESLLFQTADNTVDVNEDPIYHGDAKEKLLQDVREDLTRYQRFKSWVERNFAGIIIGMLISTAALLTTVIILSRQLAVSVAAGRKGGSGNTPSSSPCGDTTPIAKVITGLSSNLWVIVLGSVLVYMRR